MKKILTTALVIFALVGAGMAVRNQVSQETPVEETTEQPAVESGAEDASLASEPESEVAAPTDAAALSEDRIVVTYFTGDVRCPSCHQIENMTRQTVATHYADALAAGDIEFRMINVDREANRHFIKDYKLVSKTVVVSKLENGEEVDWENLQDVWRLFGDREEFEAYIRAAIETHS